MASCFCVFNLRPAFGTLFFCFSQFSYVYGYLPQFLNVTIKMSLCPNGKWDDLPFGIEFKKKNHLPAFIYEIWTLEWPPFSSRVLRSLWVSSRLAGDLLRIMSVPFQAKLLPLSYWELRLGETSPSSHGNKPKRLILGSILSSFSVHNTMSLNSAIIPSGEPKYSSKLQKMSLHFACALLIVITYYSGVIFCTEWQKAQMHLNFWAISY